MGIQNQREDTSKFVTSCVRISDSTCVEFLVGALQFEISRPE